MKTECEHELNDLVKFDGMENEIFEIVGIDLPKRKILLRGDWSQMHNVIQDDWVDFDKVFATTLVKQNFVDAANKMRDAALDFALNKNATFEILINAIKLFNLSK